MQVTHVTDHCTHAVIGGSKTIEFGISESAEFFNILSSTLYTNQRLAVVRETLCNAWDAHIAAGKTDTPIEIELTEKTFVIRDHGNGIPKDMIGPIYGVYGASTKANDGKQTGGFGLGCKAPFAYVDHFEVSSSNNGIKTLYTMSKASYQNNGKPAITEITSFPCQESGLEVRIAIKEQDYFSFYDLIREVVFNGDIKAKFTAESQDRSLDTLGFEPNQKYLFSKRIWGTNASILVRYGNVIYPVQENEAIQAEYQLVKKILGAINGGDHRGYRLVFQAPPHSISVTPSREHLSMQEKTVNTLNSMFAEFTSYFHKEYEKESFSILGETIKEMATKKDVFSLANADKPYRLLDGVSLGRLATPHEYAKARLSKQYPSEIPNFRRKDLIWRVEQLLHNGLVDRGLAQTMLKELKNCPIDCSGSGTHVDTWFQKYIARPLAKKILEDTTGLLHIKNLYVRDSGEAVLASACYWERSSQLTEIKKVRFETTDKALPYLRKLVVISPSKVYLDRLPFHPRFNTDFKGIDAKGYLVYVASRKKDGRQAAITFFKKAGYNVIDLTVTLPGEKPKTTQPAARKNKLPGLPVCKVTLNLHGRALFNDFTKETAERIQEPKCYVRFTSINNASTPCSPGFGTALIAQIFTELGHECGAVFTTREENKWKEKGIPLIWDYWADKLCKEVTSNFAYLDYMASFGPAVQDMIQKADLDWKNADLFFTEETLYSHYGLTKSLTPEQVKNVEDFLHLNRYHYCHEKVSKTYGLLTSVPVSTEAKTLIEKVDKEELLCLLDMREIKTIFRSSDEAKKQRTKEILLSIVK